MSGRSWLRNRDVGEAVGEVFYGRMKVLLPAEFIHMRIPRFEAVFGSRGGAYCAVSCSLMQISSDGALHAEGGNR